MDPKTLSIRLIKTACWVGAIVDGLWVVPMIWPEFGLTMFGLKNSEITPALRYALAIGAALMAGWTVLLLWAAHRPLERRGILLITIIPVKVGLDLASLLLVTQSLVSVNKFLLMKIDAVLVYALFIVAFVVSSPRRMKLNSTD